MRAKAILVCAFLVIAATALGATTYKTIHFFTRWDDGETPYAGVIFDPNGNLYGVTPWGETNEGVVFQLTPAPGEWTFTQLHEFQEHDTDGADLIGGLAIDEAGNLYGTASINHGPDAECGTVFKQSPTEGFSVLHKFDGTDGCDSEATLTYSNGMLWGATKGGGSHGQGTVFSMDTNGNSFQFDSFKGTKGSGPLSAFTLWGYGTTYSGGAQGKGNLYKLDHVNRLTNRHAFTVDGKAGYAPMGDLLTLYVGGVRTIYGTTSAGGVGGGGTVYRLTEAQPNSGQWRLSVLHSFTLGSAEGWAPMTGVIADAAGNLYGTTYSGGQDCGTVFKLSPGKKNKWVHTVLYSFDFYNNYEDGCLPSGGLVFDKDGNLFGTTQRGGEDFYGAVYEITP